MTLSHFWFATALLYSATAPMLAGAETPPESKGRIDYNVEADSRLYPVGAYLSGQFGYSVRLWGKQDAQFEYGYLRGELSLGTIGLTTGAVATLEVFPISLLGFYLAHSSFYRIDQSSSSYDCTTVACSGALNRTSISNRATVGFGDFFLSNLFRLEWVQGPRNDMPFADESATLVGATSSDRLFSWNATVGYQLNSRWNAGIYAGTMSYLESQNANLITYVWAQYKPDPWAIALGLGRYQSSHDPAGFTAVLSVVWAGAKGPGIF